LTHLPWVLRHSSQPLGVRGLTVRTWSRWLQCPATSAFVVLHHACGANVRFGGAVSGLLERAALAQQVPALVELGLDLREVLALVRRWLGVLEQLVLFGDELLDVIQNLAFFLHVSLLLLAVKYCSTKGDNHVRSHRDDPERISFRSMAAAIARGHVAVHH